MIDEKRNIRARTDKRAFIQLDPTAACASAGATAIDSGRANSSSVISFIMLAIFKVMEGSVFKA